MSRRALPASQRRRPALAPAAALPHIPAPLARSWRLTLVVVPSAGPGARPGAVVVPVLAL